MNKILVDNIILNNDKLLVEDKNINHIEVNNKSELSLFNCNIIDLDIVLNDNSSLILNMFCNILNENNHIRIKANNNSKIIFNYSFVNRDKYNLIIDTDFSDDNASISLSINGLNKKGSMEVLINGFVKKDYFNNILDENLRIINLDGIVKSNPNMFINTSKVIANHNTTIGGISLDEQLYLMSKGIDKDNSIKLVCNGFIVSNITNNDLKIKIKEII